MTGWIGHNSTERWLTMIQRGVQVVDTNSIDAQSLHERSIA